MEFSLIDQIDDLQEGIVNVNTIPIPREITELMQALKKDGYIGIETRAEDFALLFGRPIGKSEQAFTKIRWMAASYLLYEFLTAITRGQAEQPISLLCWLLFTDKTGNVDSYRGHKVRRRNGIEFEAAKVLLLELVERYRPKW